MGERTSNFVVYLWVSFVRFAHVNLKLQMVIVQYPPQPKVLADIWWSERVVLFNTATWSRSRYVPGCSEMVFGSSHLHQFYYV
jgi:hypothetical protein